MGGNFHRGFESRPLRFFPCPRSGRAPLRRVPLWVVVGITRALMLRLPISPLAAAACALALAATAAPALAAPPAPNVTSGGTSGVDQTVATLSGTVDPNGATTVYWFEYGT